MPVAEIGGVVEELLIVGAAVEVDGDGACWVDAGGGSVNGKFSDGNVGAVDTPVADTQDLLGIGADQKIHVRRSQPQ